MTGIEADARMTSRINSRALGVSDWAIAPTVQHAGSLGTMSSAARQGKNIQAAAPWNLRQCFINLFIDGGQPITVVIFKIPAVRTGAGRQKGFIVFGRSCENRPVITSGTCGQHSMRTTEKYIWKKGIGQPAAKESRFFVGTGANC